MSDLDMWANLNKRQQAYLKAIYRHNQLQEQNERSRAARTQHRRPAEAWRWMWYADTYAGHTPLKQDIVDMKLVDQGTGSTFKALSERGLILRRHWSVESSDVEVRLTTKGRRVARAGLEVKTPARLPVGTLQEWHWRALCRAYVAGEQGFTYDDGIARWHVREEPTTEQFGYVSWNTCLRLRDYRVKGEERPLIREGRQNEPFALCITEYGKQYYRENWQRYREMYPDVDAPQPDEKEKNNTDE